MTRGFPVKNGKDVALSRYCIIKLTIGIIYEKDSGYKFSISAFNLRKCRYANWREVQSLKLFVQQMQNRFEMFR